MYLARSKQPKLVCTASRRVQVDYRTFLGKGSIIGVVFFLSIRAVQFIRCLVEKKKKQSPQPKNHGQTLAGSMVIEFTGREL